MRRKLGIIFLLAVTVLAGTQEAARQFAGLKSSMGELTRAGLWSGLIVYAQPVSDGKLPSPQIYYLIPQMRTAPDANGALLVNNRSDDNNNTTAKPKPEAKNNHAAEELALNADGAATREAVGAAMSELAIDKLPLNLIATHLAPPPPPPTTNTPAAPKMEKNRVYVEVARNEALVRRFRHDAEEVVTKVFVKEFDAARLEAELARLAVVRKQLETSKLKSWIEPEKESPRRIEFKVVRRAPRPESVERIKVLPRVAEKSIVVMPDVSSIGCEKSDPAKVATDETAVATTNAKSASEAVILELAEPSAISIPASTNWALGCDNEPEQK